MAGQVEYPDRMLTQMFDQISLTGIRIEKKISDK